MKEAADTILYELEAFINVVLSQAQDFYYVSELSEEREELVGYTINLINEFFLNDAISIGEKTHTLNAIQSKLEKHFDAKDVIDDKFRNNIKTFYRDSGKYNYSDHILEMQDMFNVFKNKTIEPASQNQNQLMRGFKREGYKLKNIKLPLTNITQREIIEVYKSLYNAGKFEAFIQYIHSGLRVSDAPNNIKKYLLTVLDYDIGCMKSSMLWEVLGYVLIKMEEVQKSLLVFEDLFIDKHEYKFILNLFIKNNIIDPHEPSMGVIVPGSINKHTTASLIAVAVVLTQYKYLKREYTRSEQVRIMAHTYEMKASRAALTKTSPYHAAMVNQLNLLLSKTLKTLVF